MDPADSQMASQAYHDSSSVPAREKSDVSRKHARWTPTDNYAFIAACETAIADSHRHGKCFTKPGWERVVAMFNSVSGRNWTKQQLRNRWDTMRRDHKHLSKLLNCTGVEYNESMGQIVASDEWWSRKIKENKDYKDFKDKNVSEIHIRYRQLFGDSIDTARYAFTPTKLCRTGLRVFEDSEHDDPRDAIPVYDEGSGSSNEGQRPTGPSSMRISRSKSGDKRK